jgi:hypothetical protein
MSHTILERAFELARDGQVSDLEALRKRLTAEGYGGGVIQLTDHTIRRQLLTIIATATRKV